MLTLWKNKPNTSRKNERIPFSLHGSRRGLGSYLYLDFQCPPTALNMDMMSWSQPFFNWTHESNKNVLTFHLYAIRLPLFTIERASKISPGQIGHLAIGHLAYLPRRQLEETSKTI